jgi:predicted NUDIX family phosphoesterase
MFELDFSRTDGIAGVASGLLAAGAMPDATNHPNPSLSRAKMPPLPAAPAEESVLVIPRALFDTLGAFEGLCFEPDRYLHAIVDPQHAHFLPRSAAENDPSFKQIIPYAILTHGGRILHYVRGRKTGEQRLAAKGSIGIGGHVNLSDLDAPEISATTYHNGVRREVAEEIVSRGPVRESVRALLNDDSTEVGRVHLGVVHVFELENADVSPGESEITELAFLSPAELRARFDALENWSRICLEGLDGLLRRG